MKAYEHPAYNDGVRRAALRAYEDRNEGAGGGYYSPPCFKVYFDGAAIYVRTAEAAPPKDAELVCIAQHWSDKTVQLRFSGGHSEFVNF